MGNECLTVHALRRRWKPTKERLAVGHADHPTLIRLHRAFSWLARTEDPTTKDESDLHLICLWIGFNGLYGQWDPQRREPLPDRESWRKFIDRLLALDVSKHISKMLGERREHVMAILDDEYLSGFFWEEPSEIRANKARKSKFDARTWYIDAKWGMILERLIERIYLLRCQLVHGAATYGGKLNRDSLARCVKMIRHLLDSVLLVVIDHGAEEDWGTMCYPPIQ